MLKKVIRPFLKMNFHLIFLVTIVSKLWAVVTGQPNIVSKGLIAKGAFGCNTFTLVALKLPFVSKTFIALAAKDASVQFLLAIFFMVKKLFRCIGSIHI